MVDDQGRPDRAVEDLDGDVLARLQAVVPLGELQGHRLGARDVEGAHDVVGRGRVGVAADAQRPAAGVVGDLDQPAGGRAVVAVLRPGPEPPAAAAVAAGGEVVGDRRRGASGDRGFDRGRDPRGAGGEGVGDCDTAPEVAAGVLDVDGVGDDVAGVHFARGIRDLGHVEVAGGRVAEIVAVVSEAEAGSEVCGAAARGGERGASGERPCVDDHAVGAGRRDREPIRSVCGRHLGGPSVCGGEGAVAVDVVCRVEHAVAVDIAVEAHPVAARSGVGAAEAPVEVGVEVDGAGDRVEAGRRCVVAGDALEVGAGAQVGNERCGSGRLVDAEQLVGVAAAVCAGGCSHVSEDVPVEPLDVLEPEVTDVEVDVAVGLVEAHQGWVAVPAGPGVEAAGCGIEREVVDVVERSADRADAGHRKCGEVDDG